MVNRYLQSFLLGTSIVSTTSFVTILPTFQNYPRPYPSTIYVTKNGQSDNDADISSSCCDRRSIILDSATVLASFTGINLFFHSSPSLAIEQQNLPSSDLPICVIGSNGRTGMECVKACVDRSIPVRATSRSGIFNGNINSSLITPMICDVTDPKTITSAVEGSRAVIFAASASKEGGSPSAVDNIGLVNVAKACITASQVSHLVIVSSGAVTKPNSPVYRFLNLFGNIMAEKIKGEDAVRALYRGDAKNIFTVIRPGGLTEEPGRGVAALELNQGDTKSGRISRTDVAALCVESILNSQYTGDTTFECYDADTGKPLQTVGLSNILKAKTDDKEVFITGKERRGDSWEKIFSGLEKDF